MRYEGKARTAPNVLRDQVERSLAGAIGSASAHAAMHRREVLDEADPEGSWTPRLTS